MSEQKYSIVMHTPLGRKYGTMSASISGNLIDGWLDVLKHKEPFEGTIDSMGNCRITGTLITLMRKFTYTASGSLTPDDVHLQIYGERNTFELSGVSCRKGETDIK